MPVEIETILRLLKNSGFAGPDGGAIVTDGAYILLEDPTCFTRSIANFINDVAWPVIIVITAFLLLGWAISLIRGSKVDEVALNIRNLLIVFGILSAVIPIVNMIWGRGDLFGTGCRTIKVPIAEVQRLLAAGDDKLKTFNEDDLFEELYIYDSASGQSYADFMAEQSDREHTAMSPAAPPTDAGDVQEIEGIIVEGGLPSRPSVGGTEVPSSAGADRTASTSMASGNDVIYTNPDGGRYKRTGGTRAWRNKNPGNIRYSDFSRKAGAIGEAGGFAVFRDESTGRAAVGTLLKSKNYINLTVAAAISRYAPPSENDTAAYQSRIQSLTGIPVNTPMSQLNDAQLQKVVEAIKVIEGWKPGKEVGL